MTSDFGRFLIFALILILIVLTATSIGFFLGCILDNPSVAVNMSIMVFLPIAIFGGFFVNLKDVYSWLSWLQYFSPIRYSVEAMLRNEFEDNGDYDNPDAIFEAYDYDIGLYECIFILLGFALLFRILALISLKLTIKKVQ